MILSPKQRAVADAALDEECAHRHHVVIALSGAHAYGFPSPDSDLDLKAIHIAPTESLLGPDAPKEAYDRLEVIDGVEIDYTSNELGVVLRGILKGNGNFLERVLGPILLRPSAELEGLQAIARGAINRRVHHHYRGFASNQYTRVERDIQPPAKRVLYVLRTALTGTHLLLEGEVVTDVTQLLDTYGYGDAAELIEAKKAGELTRLDPPTKMRWIAELDRALSELDAAYASSPLPDEAPNRDEADAWLVSTRAAQLQR